jgi:hypothetical protein
MAKLSVRSPDTFTSIASWIDRRTSHTPFHPSASVKVALEGGGFVGIDHVVPLHAVSELQAQSLAASWHRAREYVRSACDIVNAPDGPPLLDAEEVDMILEALGPPPSHCYPLYFISIKNPNTGDETLVYIGKTSSSKNRFSGGHSAFTKLHHPRYDGFSKKVYLGTVMLIDDSGEYLPLEAAQPLAYAEQILRSVEGQLIFDLKPELNVQGVNRETSKLPLDLIHIQNTVSPFLRDQFVYRPK